ncbi:hypothetical protein F5B17DRAFT_145432 [Nemania serpens]|nr:hypothetical protein F5B17DRAFT_145432 [Nemania serpens]
MSCTKCKRTFASNLHNSCRDQRLRGRATTGRTWAGLPRGCSCARYHEKVVASETVGKYGRRVHEFKVSKPPFSSVSIPTGRDDIGTTGVKAGGRRGSRVPAMDSFGVLRIAFVAQASYCRLRVWRRFWVATQGDGMRRGSSIVLLHSVRNASSRHSACLTFSRLAGQLSKRRHRGHAQASYDLTLIKRRSVAFHCQAYTRASVATRTSRRGSATLRLQRYHDIRSLSRCRSQLVITRR